MINKLGQACKGNSRTNGKSIATIKVLHQKDRTTGENRLEKLLDKIIMIAYETPEARPAAIPNTCASPTLNPFRRIHRPAEATAMAVSSFQVTLSPKKADARNATMIGAV